MYSSDGAWPAHFFCFFWAVLAAITVACLFSFFAGASRKYISSTSFLTGTLFTKIGASIPKGVLMMGSPGTGVDIAGPGQAPGAVNAWGQQKISRALSSVTFR